MSYESGHSSTLPLPLVDPLDIQFWTDVRWMEVTSNECVAEVQALLSSLSKTTPARSSPIPLSRGIPACWESSLRSLPLTLTVLLQPAASETSVLVPGTLAIPRQAVSPNSALDAVGAHPVPLDGIAKDSS